MLDEIRHAQLDLAFSHDLLKNDERFDWCNKAFHTNEWGVLAVKNFFDDWMLNANCVEAALGDIAYGRARLHQHPVRGTRGRRYGDR